MNAEHQDIGWEQRFSNYQKALRKFIKAVSVVSENAVGEDSAISEILKEGLIQRFEKFATVNWEKE